MKAFSLLKLPSVTMTEWLKNSYVVPLIETVRAEYVQILNI